MLKISLKLLLRSQYSSQAEEFKDFFLSHPNYPSLFAITDTFSLLGIENLAVKIPMDKLEELPDFFLAGVIKHDQDDVIFAQKKDGKIFSINETGSRYELSIEEFRKIWTGLAVIIEKNPAPPEQINFQKKKKHLLFFSIICAVFMLSLFISGSGDILLFYKITSLLGLSISYFILLEKYEDGVALVSKICNFNSKTSCNTFLKTDLHIYKKIEFSDLPILFFSINFLSLGLFSNLETIIGLLSIIAIPVIVYSVYLQGVKHEKWCILCLTTSTIIIAQATLFILSLSSFQIGTNNILIYSIITLVMASIWFFCKNLLKERKVLLEKTKSLSKFKRNYDLFKFQYKEIKEPYLLEKLESIEIGQSESPIALSLFVSPSCGHCHTAYADAMELQENYPLKIKIQICYNLNPVNSDNPFLVVARTILQINKNSGDVKEALDDWHLQKMGLETWMEKWKQPINLPEVDSVLQNQYFWSQNNGLNFTPFKIINNYLFPRDYELAELKFFLNDLIEEKESLQLKL